MTQRIIAIGLDGFEPSIAKALISEGDLPFLRDLLEESATFQLDHGEARYTGLAWEHFSTGYAPSDYARWSAVDFEPSTYSIVQKATRHEPFTARLQKRVLAFDIPYHELATDNVCGLASWGAHDPGVHQHSRPDGLSQEIESRFGRYPAKRFIYGYVWPDAARTAQMSNCLDEALKLRNRIAQWLMSERLPDWDLAIMVVSEFHSGLEALWHGWDHDHPLHNVPSAGPAREGIVRLYRTLDAILKELRDRFPDAALCLFSPHGMGPNTSDLPAMALVPELMFRDAFRKPFLRAYPSFTAGIPPLMHPESWSRSVLPYLGAGSPKASGQWWSKLLKGLGGRREHRGTGHAESTEDLPLDWMPASHYQPFWRNMRAFALPSFYDARIRINLKGREAAGLVEMMDYESELDRVEGLIRELRDYRTNEPITTKITRPAADDPLDAGKSQCDLRIVWSSNVCGFIHPLLGKIGPLPIRRTGGHTGGYGLAAFANTGANPGDYGVRSTFDFVPTLMKLLGEEKLARELNGNFLV